MITIIHGDDILTSRQHFLDLKKNNSDALLLDGETLILTDIVQAAEGEGLFSKENTIFIESFLSKRKQSKEFDNILTYIVKNQEKTAFIFWEGKEIGKKLLAPFKNPKIQLFAFPNVLFSFLDSIKPGSGNISIKTFHAVTETIKEELVLFMLVRQFRLLLSVFEKSANNIDEVKRLAPWQLTKLQRQAHFFSKEQLMNIYKNLGKLDSGLKTGSLNLSLTQAIDFFLLEI